MPTSEDAYRAPRATTDVAAEDVQELAEVRRAHLSTEANIRVVGIAIMVVSVVQMIIFGVRMAGAPNAPDADFAGRVIGTTVGVLVFTGESLRRLRVLGRYILSVVAGLAFLVAIFSVWRGKGSAQVFFALWYGAALSVVWSGQATVVFGERYRNFIIPVTSEFSTRRLVAVRVLGVLALFGVGALALKFLT